jgi:hypothetical protein
MPITATTDDIRLELALLSSRVAALEQMLGKNGDVHAAPEDLAGFMAKVREITRELFPGPCHFTSEFDPEHPEDRYVVVHVEPSGDPKEIVDRECLWHERIWQLWDDLTVGILRLSVVPR